MSVLVHFSFTPEQVEGLRQVAERHGRHSIYQVASGRAPHESAYSMQKFARVVWGTNNIDNCSRA